MRATWTLGSTFSDIRFSRTMAEAARARSRMLGEGRSILGGLGLRSASARTDAKA